MLKPELQSIDDFVDGINNIAEAQQKVALRYFEDGSIEAAIPPLKILLHIMAYGNYEGKEIGNPELRKYFDRESVINSDWYKKRLMHKQNKDIAFHRQQIEYLEDFMANPENVTLVEEMQIAQRLEKVKTTLKHAKSAVYYNNLIGTIGADILFAK